MSVRASKWPFCLIIFVWNFILFRAIFGDQTIISRNDGGVKCRAPEVLIRSRDGALNLTSDVRDFDGGGGAILEVQFLGIFPPFQHRRVCKIKCVNGRWLGPLCSIEEDGAGRFQPMLRSCELERPWPVNVHLVYEGKIFIPSAELQFAHGTSLHARCSTLGLYKFVGNANIRCRNGHWEKRLPTCLPTTYVVNFTLINVPPSILYTIASGSAAASDSGDLIVYPGTILHLDCIFRRRDGNPQWSWTPNNRQYPTGWVTTLQDRDLRYRLSIYYARPQDSGIFTCSTPNGLTNSISLVIKAIECPTIVVNASTTRMIGDGSRLNDIVRFICADGHLLVGSHQVNCMWTGKWSNDQPICQVLYCPILEPTDKKVFVMSTERIHKARAQFRCPSGHRIDGPSEVICLNGTWSDLIPACVAVYCEPPKSIDNGHAVAVNERQLVGDKVHYVCDPDHIIVGESYLFCVGQGVWDNTFPTCKPICSSPGPSPENGDFQPIKEFYDVGESVTYECDDEFMIHGAQKLQCVEAGKWSSSVPLCNAFMF